jgi:homoserine kinase
MFPRMNQVSDFAPGSVGNVGPGLDILGLAVAGAGDVVTVRRIPGGRIVVRDAGHPDLTRSAARHASAIAARAALRLAGRSRGVGLEIRVRKGLPLSGGQGGSAASAVAGAVAANLLLGEPLGVNQLLLAALEAETAVAGRHLDNIAPSLLGGLTLVRRLVPPEVVRLDPPRRMLVVLAKPDYQLATRRGRSVLPRLVPRGVALQQAANVAAMVAAARSNDTAAFGRAIDDRIAEPVRAALLPGFRAAKRAALAAGAYGCSISGSGPTAFAITDAPATAERVAEAMRGAYHRAGFACATRIARADRKGARVL